MSRKSIGPKMVGALLAVSLVFAACGDSDDDPSASDTASPTGADGANADLPPLEVMFISLEGSTTSLSLPEGSVAAKAAADYINAELDGINGREIEYSQCDYSLTPESLADCANQAVDADVDLVVQSATAISTGMLPILTGAGIPLAVAVSGEPELHRTPGVFVMSMGSVLGYATLAAYAEEEGWEQATILAIDTAAGRGGIETFAVPAFETGGVELHQQYVAVGTPDMTPAFSSAIESDPEAVMAIGDANACATMLSARNTVTYDGAMFVTYACDDENTVWSAAGEAGEGTYIVTPYATALEGNDDVETYNSAMEEFAPGSNTAGIAPSSFAVMVNIQRALSTVDDPGTLDASSISTAIEEADGAPLFFGNGAEMQCGEALDSLPSVCDLSSHVAQREGGSSVYVTQFDVSEYIAAAVQ